MNRDTSMHRCRVLVVTEAFPFTEVEEFVGTELRSSRGDFEFLTLATRPRTKVYPHTMDFRDSTFPRLLWTQLIFALSRFPIGAFLRDVRDILQSAHSLSAVLETLIRTVRRYAYGTFVAFRIATVCRTEAIDVIYAFWGNAGALGATMVADDIPVLVRLHGGDLYVHRAKCGVIPGLRAILHGADVVVLPSAAGERYFCSRWPHYAEKARLCRLGVPDVEDWDRTERINCATVVSIAYVSGVKRLGLLADAVALAVSHGVQLNWVHIGDGPDFEDLAAYVAQLGICDRVSLVGGQHPDAVVPLLQSLLPHVAVNVSESEGGCPVSLQQALSVGIPIAATDVGGNTEIVQISAGKLLPSTPTSQDVLEAILSFVHCAADERVAARIRSQEAQRKHFSALRNVECIESLLRELCVAFPSAH